MSLTRSQVVFSSKEAVLAEDWSLINAKSNKEWNSRGWFAWAPLVEENDLVMEMSIAGVVMIVSLSTLYFSGLKKPRSVGSVPPPGPPAVMLEAGSSGSARKQTVQEDD
jgi:hypothetical protein